MYKHEKFSTIKTLCEQTTRTLHNRIVLCKDFTQKSNTRYYISDINSCSVTQNGTGDEQISMSGAPSSQVSCEMWLMNEDNLTTLSAVESREATQISLTNLVGYFIRPEVGIIDTEGNIIYTPLGIYEITEATSKSDWKTVNITAYDIMSTKLQSYTFDSAQFTSEYTKPTVANFLTFVDNQTSYITGYDVIANSTTYTTKILNKVLFDSTNGIDYVSYFNGKTLRETLAGISGIVGCNALVRADADEDENTSSLCLTFFTSPESAYNITAPRDMQYQSETKIADDVDFLITSCTSSDNEEENESYTATYNNQDRGVGVTFSNEVIKHADIDLIAGKKTTETYGWANKSYMPMEFTWRSNPCIQVGDIISVETATGTYKNCYIAKQVLDICGGFKSTVTCPKGDAEVSFSSGEYVTPAELKKTTENLKKTMNEATQTISGANGGYVVHLDLNNDKQPDNIFITDVSVNEDDFEGNDTDGYYLKKSENGRPNAKSVIRINSGGIGLSYNENGNAGTSNDMFNVAITGKGIVADYLYTGIINKGYETYFDLGTNGNSPSIVTKNSATNPLYSSKLEAGKLSFVKNAVSTSDTDKILGILGPISSYTYSATCSTESSEQNKVISINNFSYTTSMIGCIIKITFQNTTTHTSPYLQINSLSAKAIKYYKDGYLTDYNSWAAGETIYLTYDGIYWVYVERNTNSDEYYQGMMYVDSIGDGISFGYYDNENSNVFNRLVDIKKYDTSNGGYIEIKNKEFGSIVQQRDLEITTDIDKKKIHKQFITKLGVGNVPSKIKTDLTFYATLDFGDYGQWAPIVNTGDYELTNYVEIADNSDVISFNGLYQVGYSHLAIYFYDTNKTKLSTSHGIITSYNTITEKTLKNYTCGIPDNTKYYKLIMQRSSEALSSSNYSITDYDIIYNYYGHYFKTSTTKQYLTNYCDLPDDVTSIGPSLTFAGYCPGGYLQFGYDIYYKYIPSESTSYTYQFVESVTAITQSGESGVIKTYKGEDILSPVYPTGTNFGNCVRFWVKCTISGTSYWAGVYSSSLKIATNKARIVLSTTDAPEDIRTQVSSSVIRGTSALELNVNNSGTVTDIARMEVYPGVGTDKGTRVRLRSRADSSTNNSMTNSYLEIAPNAELRVESDKLRVYDGNNWHTIASW